MYKIYQIVIFVFVFDCSVAFSQPNMYSINALVMLNGESGERLILKKEKLQTLDSLIVYNDDSSFILSSFRFTATFPGGISDWISDSNKLTPEMKDTLKFIKKNGFILFSEFVIKNDNDEIVEPYYKSIYIQIVN